MEDVLKSYRGHIGYGDFGSLFALGDAHSFASSFAAEVVCEEAISRFLSVLLSTRLWVQANRGSKPVGGWAEEVGFEPTTRFSLSIGVYERLLCTQKLPCLSTEDAHYLLLSIVFAVSFAVRAGPLTAEDPGRDLSIWQICLAHLNFC